MRVKRHDDEFRMRAEIFAFDDSDGHTVNVERQRDLFHLSKWEAGPRINGSAFGNPPVEMPRLYAAAMLEACRIADEMNAVPDNELTTPGGYMVAYERDGRSHWERIGEGAEVPMYDGWTVARAQRAGAKDSE